MKLMVNHSSIKPPEIFTPFCLQFNWKFIGKDKILKTFCNGDNFIFVSILETDKFDVSCMLTVESFDVKSTRDYVYKPPLRIQ